jgi:uncharacterized membrane protein
MGKGRLEAFSDGVIAIIITIMVLELKVPHSADWHSLREMTPIFLCYLLSFIFVGIYWGNHHHLISTVKQVNGSIMWANMHLLFWLSLVPFATAWMGENCLHTNTVVVYGIVLELCGVAFYILQQTISRTQQHDKVLDAAIRKGVKKGIFSLFAYAIAIGFAFFNTAISCALFVVVAIVWLIPERNIERVMGGNN